MLHFIKLVSEIPALQFYLNLIVEKHKTQFSILLISTPILIFTHKNPTEKKGVEKMTPRKSIPVSTKREASVSVYVYCQCNNLIIGARSLVFINNVAQQKGFVYGLCVYVGRESGWGGGGELGSQSMGDYGLGLRGFP